MRNYLMNANKKHINQECVNEYISHGFNHDFRLVWMTTQTGTKNWIKTDA